MLNVRDQLCYSPHPPERYGIGALGLGPAVRTDIQLWNLLYLSIRDIDDYRSSERVKVQQLLTRDMNVYAAALASLQGENCREMFPTLRQSLCVLPEQFLKHLWKMPWEQLPLAREIPFWNHVLIDRALDISTEMKILSSPLVTLRTGNVFNVQFRSDTS